MARTILDDTQRSRVAHLLPGKPGDPGRHGRDNRLFLEGVLWIARTGAPWRDLPEAFGRWNTVFRRFSRWSEKGVFETVFKELSSDADFEYLMADGMVVRAHQPAAGALKKDPQAIGRSRGGPTTKIVALTDALGNLVRFALLPGHRHELPAVAALLAGLEFGGLIADKAYDADALRAELADRGAEAIIPPRANRADEIECDAETYKWHHLVENFFCNIKRFRRIATRYEKTDSSYRGMIHAVSSCLALA